MEKKSYWIWHYGEYEIFHSLKTNFRREQQGFHRPPFWKISVPYVNVHFRKVFECDGGYLKCFINGQGHVQVGTKQVGRKRYKAGERIELKSGENTIEVFASNLSGLPAIYVESDVCPSDKSWLCNHFAGDFESVGMNEYFDSVEKSPDDFPFSYENKLPTSKEIIDEGVLYDFGTEIFGYLNLDCCSPQESYGVFYGESREEALDTEHSCITDELFGSEEYKLKQRAFRYVYIKSAPEGLKISADYEFLPLVQKGRFECNDDLFNEIYSVAAYTFHLNCRETFLDGIKRDRWTWAGDAYQSARINAYLFADKEIEQRTAISLVGKEPVEQHLNTIVDYSLLWIIGLKEHYMVYGDVEFLSRIYHMTVKLLEFCELRKNADGFIEGIKDDWTFIDWAPMDKHGAIAAEQMLMIAVYFSMNEISKALGYQSEVYLHKACELRKRVNEYYWNDEKGAFIDSYSSGKNNVTRHANIFAILYDIATEEQKKSILKNVLSNDGVPKITTPYFKGYELDALGLMGEYNSIENQIRSYYGDMIKLGAKTIWEEYDPSKTGIEHYAMYNGKYEKSLCHAWGAGPIYIFGRYYLGVYPTSAGYETFNVEPSLGGFRQINGVVPINEGTVAVEMNGNELSVIATKAGGTLIWQGKKYLLPSGEKIVVKMNC